MFNIITHQKPIQVNTPAVVFSSFRPAPLTSTPLEKAISIPVESVTSKENTIEAVCAEMPKKLQLGKPIWDSIQECPKDFWERDLKVDKRLEGTASCSPSSPVFSEYPHIPSQIESNRSTQGSLALPKPSTPTVKEFTTPTLIETAQVLPEHGIMSEKLHEAWLGTNVTIEAEWTIAPSKAILDDVISRRASIEAILVNNPYDPQAWLELAHIYFELCFNDLQVASAHKAIFLINQGLDSKDEILGREVRRAVGSRLSCRYDIVVADDLENELLEAHKALLRGLFEMCAYWDGLKEAKKALSVFPADKALLLLQRAIKDEFCSRTSVLQKSKHSAEDIKALSRAGRSFKRKYPWLDDKLFIRPPASLRDINARFNSANCEVRPLFASQYDINATLPRRSHRIATKFSMQHTTAHSTDTETNVGPLGVFANHTIHKDEILLIDHNITIVPVTPPVTKLQHCDACQALLMPPFLPDDEKKYPRCCKDVAYCSSKCATTALNGYHKLICGKDFNWLYQSAKMQDLDPSWEPLALLRILAIVVSDLKAASDKTAEIREQPVPHPLQHPLLSRLSAGYESSPTHAHSGAQVWNYFSHVVAPARILAQLGADIFADTRWSAEVIHTIYWRIVNNACRVSSCTVVNGKLERMPLAGISPGYVFFNHSCGASAAWLAAGSAEGAARIAAATALSTGTGNTGSATAAAIGPSQLGKRRRGSEVTNEAEADTADIVRVGCNAIVCFATRDIKKGEEARISYLPPGKRQQLGVWFEGGKCLCGVCSNDNDDAQETG